MHRGHLLKASLLFLLLAALPLGAWGDKGHRTVSALALTTLPPAPRAWFAGQESVLVDHASDPDHWKTDKKEGPRHYMNLEAFGGSGHLPRSLEQAREAAGADYYRKGVVPWVIQDRWRDLVAAFRSGDPAQVALASAVLGHYIGDAHVPLHTTLDHDGKTTDQTGIHSRWETGLVGRLVTIEGLHAAPAKPDPALLSRPWEWLEQAHALVPKLLADDQAADRTTPRTTRGKTRGFAYWAIFEASQGPMVKQQLERAAQHLGDAILNAWIEAGSPAPQKN